MIVKISNSQAKFAGQPMDLRRWQKVSWISVFPSIGALVFRSSSLLVTAVLASAIHLPFVLRGLTSFSSLPSVFACFSH